MTPIPPPRSSSKLIDLTRYMPDTNNNVGGCSSNASPTISEFTRIYDNIVEPTAYLNISDLESIFSTNTAYSETTTQTTVETVAAPELKRDWPPPPQLPSLNEIIKSSNVKCEKPLNEHDHNQKHHHISQDRPQSYPNELKERASLKREQLIDSTTSNVTIQSTASTTNDADVVGIKAQIIPVDLLDESNTATNLNNNNTSNGSNTRGNIIVDVDATRTTTTGANERNQQYLFDSHKNININGEGFVGRYNYNNHKFGLDCQIMTNCGNEDYNDDKETTAASTEIKGCDQQRNLGGRENCEMVKLAERIKGEKWPVLRGLNA